MIPLGVQLELTHALIDAQNAVNEYGTEFQFAVTEEADLTRDKYNSIKKRIGSNSEVIDWKAYPVVFSPNSQRIEKAGLKEACDCMIYTAYKDWTDKDYDINSMDMTRLTVLMDGWSFRIKEKGYIDRFANSFLYVSFGLEKI